MNKFEKISFEQYNLDTLHNKDEYDDIKIPKRATRLSAGYDFFAPHDITIPFNGSVTIATGIRILLDEDKVLQLYPRSGLGFKYGISLANTCGIIDADYCGSKNEGHILVKLENHSLLSEGKDITIKKGDAFCQGVIYQYHKVVDDESNAKRNGGFGSTNNK